MLHLIQRASLRLYKYTPVSHPVWWENAFETKVNNLVEVYGVSCEFNCWTDYQKGSVVYQGQRMTVLDAFKQQTRSFGNRFNIATPSVRWVFGWHGTSLDSAIKISAGSFDTTGENYKDGWFGYGNYFATSSRLSYSYAESKGNMSECVCVVFWLPLINLEVLEQPPQMRRAYEHPYENTDIAGGYGFRVVPVSPDPYHNNWDYDTQLGGTIRDFKVVLPVGHSVMPRFMVRMKKDDTIIDTLRENFSDIVKHALGGGEKH